MPVCPHCGGELKAGDPAGLCPKCLILGALDSLVGAEESGTQLMDTGAAIANDEDFGHYHILRTLGEGGMGTVYLAEQREPIRRCVALKVVKLGMDTARVLARFANERQALAIMDHPSIARIIDAGATTKGRPYFVMEYIEGAPITQYCDSTRMTIGERLELFLAVCRAVHHAHQKGVIHRDLKPSNVLVMEQDGKPVPKVIDFGIAKATDQWAIEKTLLTEFGQMVGTPEYASPEQAEMTTGDVDEMSDVYALGVILYELLIGTVPFDAARLREAGLAGMLRVIREEDAPPLARKLTAMGAAAGDIAVHRQTDPASLRRLANGDLNSITLKALEKGRQRRYASVAELAADVQRYIDHRPVLAAPPSYLYQARKFLQRHRLTAFATAAGLVFILLGGVTVWSLARRDLPTRPRVTEKGTVVLGDFANSTGDLTFDGTLRRAIALELEKSPYFNVLSDARTHETLRLMVRAPNAKLTPDIAAEICERTGSSAVVEGSIARLGSQYLLGLRARNCQTGDVLDEEQESAAKKEDLFNAIAQLAKRFLTRAGGSLPRVAKQPDLSAEITTPSLEAWKSYKAAMSAAQHEGSPAEVLSLAKRAIELDPKFAMAYALLGRTYDALGETEPGAQSITKAYELRDRVSDRENYFITFNYYRQVPRNLELARQTLESWVQKYPDEVQPHSFLSAFTSQGSGHYEKAVEEGEKAIGLDPDFAIAYENVTFAYIYLNRLAEAETVLHNASERKIETVELSICRYNIAFLKGDQAAMDREVSRRKAKLEAQGLFEHQEALTAAYHGRLNEAARLSDRAAILARQAGLRERAAQFESVRGAWNALFGNLAGAQRSAVAALSLFRGRDIDYASAFALAFVHDSAQSRQIQADLERRYTEDTSVHFNYLPVLRALEALNQGDAAKALEVTQVAAPYDLAVPGTAFYSGSFFGALYPVYVRGLACSRMSRQNEAAAEFQKILDHPGITLNDSIGPLARLQLARALYAAGDRTKAAAVYKDLLTIWKDADPDIPIVQQARAESTRLQ